MRKRLAIISVIVLSLALATTAIAADQITLIVNGRKADTAPILVEGRTYVPVRAAAELLGAQVDWDGVTQTVTITSSDGPEYDMTLVFPVDIYPQTAAHIQQAIQSGKSDICTIDRSGADQRREQSLAGIPTRDGYDRDEWPMAMCAEGGAGASVAYVESSDNRGAGAWVGNALEGYPDGTRVKFVLGSSLTVEIANQKTNQDDQSVYYRTCADARAAGAAPLRKGDPGYGSHLDRDGDGIACE